MLRFVCSLAFAVTCHVLYEYFLLSNLAADDGSAAAAAATSSTPFLPVTADRGRLVRTEKAAPAVGGGGGREPEGRSACERSVVDEMTVSHFCMHDKQASLLHGREACNTYRTRL